MEGTQQEAGESSRIRRGSIRGLFVSFGGQGLCLVIACAQIAVISRILPPEMFGVFGMTWAVLSLLYNIKDLGFSTAVVQYLSDDQEYQDAAFWMSVLGGVAMAAFVALLAPVLALFYGHGMVEEACLKLAPMFAIGGITSHYQAILRRRLQYVRLNTVTVIAQLVGTGGAIALALAGRGIDALVFQTLGQELTFLLILPFISGWRPRSFSLRKFGRQLFSFGGNLSIFRLVQNLSSTMDHVSLGLFTSPAVVGLYNRAQTLLSTPRRQLVLPLSQVLPTMLAQLQEEGAAFARASANIVSGSALVWFSFLALIFAAPEPVLHLCLGGQWGGAALIMQLLSIGEMARLPLMMINMAETQLGHARSLRNFGLLSAPLTAAALMLGSWLGGEEKGALYMAAAYAVLQVGLLALRMIQIGGRTPLKPGLMLRALALPLAVWAALVAAFRLGAFGGRFLHIGAFGELAGAGAAGLALFALLLFLSPRSREASLRILRDVRGAFSRRR